MEKNNHNKKILFISARSDQGGGPKHLKDLTIELKNQNPAITFFFATPLDLPFGIFFQQHGAQHIKIPARSFSIGSFFEIIKLIKKFDITNVHGHGRGAGIYSRLLKLFIPKIHIIHTYHGIHHETGIKGFIKICIDRLLVYLTNAFIFVSHDEKHEGLTKNLATPKKSFVIHNGIPALSLLPLPKSPPPFQLVTTARVHYQKGYDLGIDLLNQFKIKNPNLIWEWHIAGPEEDDEIIKLKKKLNDSIIKEQVYFWGNQSTEKFLENKHLYISFSRWEGLPLAPIESFIMGVPCLLSKVTGHGDLIREIKSIPAFDLNDYNSFEKELIEIMNHYSNQLDLTRSAHNLVSEKFSVAEMAKKTYCLYV